MGASTGKTAWAGAGEALPRGTPQPAKNGEGGGPGKGYDGHRRVNGRRRHIVADTLGIQMCIVETAANGHDGVAAERVSG